MKNLWVENLNFSYETVSRFKSNFQSFGSQSYSYDLSGQLTVVTGSENETFTYDSLGNRITDQNGNYVYDPSGQRLTEDYQYIYNYDLNGNLIQKFPKDQSKEAYTYSYSSKNQLISVNVLEYALGQVKRKVSFKYDVLGRRIQKESWDRDFTQDPTKTYIKKYVYDGDNVLFEYDGSNNLLAKYTHSPLKADDVLAVEVQSAGVTAGLAQVQGKYQYLKDSLGSVTEVVSNAGTIVQRYEYSSFGKLKSIKDLAGNDISANPVVRTSYTYTGREYDAEAGLYYYRARYYDPQIGRFLQQDPDPGKMRDPSTYLSKYVYVGNKPISLTDPSGMSWLSNFWDHNNEWVRDVAVTAATIAILVIAGVPTLGALAAVGSVAGGALVASMAIASRQDGNFWDNTANAFHTNFRIGSAFLALSGIAAATFGGGLAGAGGNGLNGWVLSKNSFFLSKGYEGDLTMGSAALFNGTMRFASHSFGHSLQFIGIGLITGDTNSTWKYFLGTGLIGTTPIGNFWEHGADFLGGL